MSTEKKPTIRFPEYVPIEKLGQNLREAIREKIISPYTVEKPTEKTIEDKGVLFFEDGTRFELQEGEKTSSSEH